MSEQPTKRVRGPESDRGPVEPPSDIDLLPDVALVALMVNLPDEKARGRMCRANKRAYNLCRGPDVYRELVEREFFHLDQDREIRRLKSAVVNNPLQHGRLLGAIMHRESEIVQELNSYKVELAGIGPGTWHEYYLALVFLSTTLPKSLRAEYQFHTRPFLFAQLQETIKESIKDNNLAMFNSALTSGDIPLGFDGSRARSELFMQLIKARTEAETADQFGDKLRNYQTLVSDCGGHLGWALFRLERDTNGRPQKMRAEVWLAMLHTVIDTIYALGKRPNDVLGKEVALFHVNLNETIVEEFVRALAAGRGYTAEALKAGKNIADAARLISAAAQWMAITTSDFAILFRLARTYLPEEPPELGRAIEDKLK
jgi:hypothetical protein